MEALLAPSPFSRTRPVDRMIRVESSRVEPSGELSTEHSYKSYTRRLAGQPERARVRDGVSVVRDELMIISAAYTANLAAFLVLHGKTEETLQDIYDPRVRPLTSSSASASACEPVSPTPIPLP